MTGQMGRQLTLQPGLLVRAGCQLLLQALLPGHPAPQAQVSKTTVQFCTQQARRHAAPTHTQQAW